MAQIRDRDGLGTALPILIGASVMLSLAMGLRQSLGLFMPSITHDLHISVSDFTVAIAVQNLVWGFCQPLAGAWAVRSGYRPVMVTGAVLYITGLVVLAFAGGKVALNVGAGLLIGVSLACTASAIAMAVSARAVSASKRSLVFGVVSAAGSIGAAVAAPLGQALLTHFGWRYGAAGFAILACMILPAAWIAGRADAIPLSKSSGTSTSVDEKTGPQAAASALRNVVFLVMATAYFVCGMQLVFLTTHLPSYLAICGMDPALSAEALAVIGAFNVLGSLFFGWAGGKWNKLALLGSIYVSRSAILALYFFWPPTPTGTLVFAAAMGFLWLGVAPLVSGAVVEMFGLRWQAMIGGLAFVGHQLGSFAGALGGGLFYDAFGSYDLAWRAGVALGLIAGVVQTIFAFARPTRPAQFAPA